MRIRVRLAMVLAIAMLPTACGGSESDTVTPTTETSAPPASSVETTETLPSETPTTPSSSSSTSRASTTTVAPTTTSTTAPRRDAAALGFGEVAFGITPPGGAAAMFCALLAEAPHQLAKGLMGRRDLAGYDAMVFRFAADTTAEFYMRNVPVGLSIAWFAADGRFVSATDMAPCADVPDCPTYGAAGPYRYAIEVLQGGLGPLGIGEGSMLRIHGACTP